MQRGRPSVPRRPHGIESGVSNERGAPGSDVLTEVVVLMFCPKCGAKNPDGSKFCFSCGEKLREMPQKANVPQAQPAAAPVQAPVSAPQGVEAEGERRPAKSSHDSAYRFKCILFGGIYVALGIAMISSGSGDEIRNVGIFILVYAAWLLSGLLTGGWRIFVY